jgi:hypothetical protein
MALYLITNYDVRFLQTNINRVERGVKWELAAGRIYLVTGGIWKVVGGGQKFKMQNANVKSQI